MIRELGPVLTGLMVTGRAGSAITAELGTMRITEQIDALKTLRINTFQYLVVPRILAGLIILPFLALFCMICGIIGGYVVCVYILELSPEDYTSAIRTYVEMSDIRGGLIKSAVFGLILSWVGSYKGYTTMGGARGVGESTTKSVVIASIMILISNYFLTKFLERL
jgi:phospholipid/cholesterol/gamma-HCH transport system permease protein